MKWMGVVSGFGHEMATAGFPGLLGGYIMANGAAIDEVKPENLKAMIDFTKEYGVYK